MVPAALFSGQEQFMAFSFQVKAVLDEIIQQLPDPFNMEEMMGKAKEKTPYTVVALQECERMNILTNEMRRSLKELDLGLQVHSTRCWGTSQHCTALSAAFAAAPTHQAGPGAPGSPGLVPPEPTHGPRAVPAAGPADTAWTFLLPKGRADDHVRDGRAVQCSLL